MANWPGKIYLGSTTFSGYGKIMQRLARATLTATWQRLEIFLRGALQAG
jgi:hypothetical protein